MHDLATHTAIILFAHGARDPQWAEPFEQLVRLVGARRPDSPVRLAFLELMTPSLADCVAELVACGSDRILISPIFMARGAHLRRDLPAIVESLRQAHPGVSFEVTEAIGEAASLQAAMADWIAQRVSV